MMVSALLVALTAGIAVAATVTCKGSGSTCRGTNENDAINGAATRDVIYALAGDDRVRANDGADVVFGGAGIDNISGGPRNDVLYGNIGNDIMTGGSGNDDLNGGGGNDTLTGNVGMDDLYGAAGDDTINARDGEEDSIFCGDGIDTVTADVIDNVSTDCERVNGATVQQQVAPANATTLNL